MFKMVYTDPTMSMLINSRLRSVSTWVPAEDSLTHADSILDILHCGIAKTSWKWEKFGETVEHDFPSS